MKQFLSIKFGITLVLAPLLVCCIALPALNYLKPLYLAEATIMSNQSSVSTLNKGLLKSLDQSTKRLIKLDHWKKKQSSALVLGVKMALLQSWQLRESFIIKYNLKSALYPSSWDAESGQWKAQEPTLWQASNKLLQELKVSQDGLTGFIRISFISSDAKVGATIINQYIKYANEFIAQHESKEIYQKIARTEAILAQQELNIMKNILLLELENLRRSVVMEHRDVSTAFKVVDPAYAAEEKYFRAPKNLVILLVLLTWILCYIRASIVDHNKVDRLFL